jgi:hypothetical protein
MIETSESNQNLPMTADVILFDQESQLKPEYLQTNLGLRLICIVSHFRRDVQHIGNLLELKFPFAVATSHLTVCVTAIEDWL